MVALRSPDRRYLGVLGSAMQDYTAARKPAVSAQNSWREGHWSGCGKRHGNKYIHLHSF